MTEKISRRGIVTPHSYQPDILEKTKVTEILNEENIIISDEMKLGEIRNWLEQETEMQANYFIVADNEGDYQGVVSLSTLFNSVHDENIKVGDLVKRKNLFLHEDDNLKTAVEIMTKENVDILPIITGKEVKGILSFKHILSVYTNGINENENSHVHISINRQRLKILLKGQKLASMIKNKK